jgi:hypothetical protein
MLSALDAAQAEIARLQAYRLRLLAALEANGHPTEIGARDTVQLIAMRHRLDAVDVRRDLRLASALPKYAEVNAALTADAAPDAPVLHPAQAEAIVTSLERIPATAMVPVDDLRVAEQQMVEAAQVLSPGDLRKLGKAIRDTLDTDGTEPAEARALAAETLWLKRGDHGAEFGGYLAGEHAELFQTLIFAGSRPHLTADGRRDPRSRGKRQAAALTTILTAAASTGAGAPAHGDIKPHVTVTIDLEDLKAIPMILGANSEPLDVGTEHRFVTRAIRQALNVRDRGCVICSAPPAMSEAHHIIHWADGGPTALTNLALLCKAHHIEVHQGHWNLHFHQGHPQYTRPTWSTTRPPPHPGSSTPSPSTHPGPSTPHPSTHPGRTTPPSSTHPGRATPRPSTGPTPARPPPGSVGPS